MADPPWNTEDLPESYQTDKLLEIFRELAIVRDHPRMLILVTHGFVERMISVLVKAKLKNQRKILNDNRSYSHSARILILNEVGVISDEWFRFLDWFRKLRNRAAHDAIFTLSHQDLAHLHTSVRSPSEFYALCLMFMRQFWDEHRAVLAPVRAPDSDAGDNP